MKRTVDELMRLAFLIAEADRSYYAECDDGDAGKEAGELAKEMRKYRVKRWGKTEMEAAIEAAPLVPIKDIQGSGRT